MPPTQIARICTDGAETRPHLSRSDRAARCQQHHDRWRKYQVDRAKLVKKIQAGTAAKTRLRDLTAAYNVDRDNITQRSKPAPTAAGTAPQTVTRAHQAAGHFTREVLDAWNTYQRAASRGRDARTQAAAKDALTRAISKAVGSYQFMMRT